MNDPPRFVISLMLVHEDIKSSVIPLRYPAKPFARTDVDLSLPQRCDTERARSFHLLLLPVKRKSRCQRPSTSSSMGRAASRYDCESRDFIVAAELSDYC